MQRETVTKSCFILLAAWALMVSNPVYAESSEEQTARQRTAAKTAGKKDRDIVVNCNRSGASIQKAINKVKPGKKQTIYVRGFCNERVRIRTDGITLHGDRNEDDDIDGGLTEVQVIGARNVVIYSLELTGAGYGVLATDGAIVRIDNNNIHDNVDSGVAVGNMSLARVIDNTIINNGRPAPYWGAGIDVWAGSVVRSLGNYVEGSGYAAVQAGSQAYFRSGLFSPDGPPDPEELDIFVQKGCTRGQTAGTCGEPDTAVMDIYRGGIADVRNTEATGISYISGLSNLDARTSIINGDVEGSGGSRLHLRSSVTGSGLVSCYSESFASSFSDCGEILPATP